MKKILYLLTIVIMALLSLFILVAEVVAAQPVSNNQEILLCIKYPLNETTLSPPLVVFKSQLDTLLESTPELVQSKNASPSEKEPDDTLF